MAQDRSPELRVKFGLLVTEDFLGLNIIWPSDLVLNQVRVI